MFKSIFLHLLILLFFVSESDAQTVETITSSFNASGGVAINDSGYIYVANFGAFLNNANGRKVYKVNDEGIITEFADGLLGASGNDFDSKGNLFQSNIAGNKLSKITPDGTVSTFATSGITGPVGVAVADGDTIYVANCGGNNIAKVTPDGNSSVWVSSGYLQCPNGLTIDDDHNIYTCNFANGDVIKITPGKEVTVLATLPGGRCGHLTFFEGKLYVVARCVHQIYEVTLNGVVTLLAGSGERGNDDGDALNASFNHPNGIRAKREGDNIYLYINDATSLSGDCLTAPLNPVVLRRIAINSTTPVEDEASLPEEFLLEQNYPNPFNPSTSISYSIPVSSFVTLKIYDLLGNEVTTLVKEEKPAGVYQISFDASQLPSGVYVSRLTSGKNMISKKMILAK